MIYPISSLGDAIGPSAVGRTRGDGFDAAAAFTKCDLAAALRFRHSIAAQKPRCMTPPDRRL
jgi:hypothetical protein